jgi:hypothetical protein
LVPVPVEARIAVVCPLASVTTEGWVSVLPVPVALTVTVLPEIGLL